MKLKTVTPTPEEDLDADNLPNGWVSSTIGDIADVVAGGTPTASDETNFSDDGYPWITPADLSNYNSMYIQRGRRSLSEKGLQTSAAKMLPKGTVLMSSRAPIGYVAIAANPISTNQGFKNFICHEEVAPEYVYYWIKYLNPYLEGMGSGSTFAEISGTRAKKIPIKYPPLAEQHRIVARVGALLAHVNAARDRLCRMPLIMKRLRQEVLTAACLGRLTERWREKNPDVEPANELISKILDERKLWYDSEVNKAKFVGRKKPKKPKLIRNEMTSEEFFLDLPDSWDICFFEDIAANSENAIKAGPFGSSLTKSCYMKSGYKIYGQEQVIKGDPTYGDYWISEEKYRELESCKVRPGDILISLVGTVGKVLVLPDDCKVGIINPRLVKMSIDKKISKHYVKIYLESPIAKNRLFGDSHGGTMEILNLEILKNLPIPLPPLAEQHEIVRCVNALFERADQIEEQVIAATKRTEALTQALLGKAFRGDLTTNDSKAN
jgi:type I restriction enzyme S subunit